MSEVPIQKLLQGAFKGDDWSYVSQHPVFVEQMRQAAPTHIGFENLVQIGSLLLRQREELQLMLIHQSQKQTTPKE